MRHLAYMLTPPEITLRRLIGIGRDFTASPLPQPPDRRVASPAVRQRWSGGAVTPTGVSSPGVPAVGASQAPAMIRPLARGHLTAPLQAPIPLHPSGLQPAPAGLRCCRLTSAGRSGRIAPPQSPGHPAGLLWSAGRPAVHSRRIDPKYAQLWMEDFVMACPLVPTVPHRLSGSCPTPRTVVPRGLQTPPRGEALAFP